jgi:hypothetical protein
MKLMVSGLGFLAHLGSIGISRHAMYRDFNTAQEGLAAAMSFTGR